MKSSPLFVKTYDLLGWLLNRTGNFPRHQRPVLGRRIQEMAFCLYETLVDASKAPNPGSQLQKADAALIKLRTYIRLSCDMKLVSFDQYQYASNMMGEVGRLLGGWQKSVARNANHHGG